MRVLGISGSLRRDSYNSRLLRAAAGLLPPGAELEVWTGLKAVPPFDEDDEPRPGPAVDALRAAVGDADALLVSTPEYNHSVPGQLKNAIDWLSRPFDGCALRGKPAVVVGASTGLFGAVWAQAEVRKALAAAGARVLDEELPIGQAAAAFDVDGLRDPEPRAALAELLTGLMRLLPSARTGDLDGPGAALHNKEFYSVRQSVTRLPSPEEHQSECRRSPSFRPARPIRPSSSTARGARHASTARSTP